MQLNLFTKICSAIQERSRRRIVITFNRVQELREPETIDFETGHTMLSPAARNNVTMAAQNIRNSKVEIVVNSDGQTTVLERGKHVVAIKV